MFVTNIYKHLKTLGDERSQELPFFAIILGAIHGEHRKSAREVRVKSMHEYVEKNFDKKHVKTCMCT